MITLEINLETKEELEKVLKFYDKRTRLSSSIEYNRFYYHYRLDNKSESLDIINIKNINTKQLSDIFHEERKRLLYSKSYYGYTCFKYYYLKYEITISFPKFKVSVDSIMWSNDLKTLIINQFNRKNK